MATLLQAPPAAAAPASSGSGALPATPAYASPNDNPSHVGAYGTVVGAANNFAQGIAKSEVGLVQNLGQTVLKGVDAATGAVTGGKGTNLGGSTFATNPNALTPQGTSQKVGNVVGTVAPYLTGAGEEDLAATAPEWGGKVASVAGKTAGKVASWLTERAPAIASNTAIGTSQTGSLKKGVESAGFAEVGQEALKGAGKVIASGAKRAESAVIDALTPKLGVKGYEKTALGGTKVTAPSVFGKADVVGDSLKSVQNAKEAITNVASALGKKVTDIIGTGSGSVTKNFNNISNSISEYAQKYVKPFLQSSGVSYNFSDLRDALTLVKPPADITGTAAKTYNAVREEILNAVANKVSPQVTGGKSLSVLRGMAGDTGTIPGKTTNGDVDFWDARKIIDDIGIQATKGKIFNSPEHAGATKAWSDIRAAYKNYLSDGFRYPGQMENVNKANNFLSTSQVGKMDKTGWDIGTLEKQFGLTPSPQTEAASKQWDTYMKNLEGMYQGRANIATKLGGERGETALSAFGKEHPTIKKAAEATAKVIGTGLATGVGLGSIYEGAKKLGL